MKTWASPNLSKDNNTVYIVSRGIGLHAIDVENGMVRWKYSLGQPWNHLSGVALNENETIYAVSQRRFLHAVSPTGQCLWRFNCQANLDLWGNPSVDSEYQRVYFTGARGRDIGYAFAVDFYGHEIWRCKLPGGTRGGLAIGRSDFCAVACLNGDLVLLSRLTGRLIAKISLTHEPNLSLWTTPTITPDDKVIVALVQGPKHGSVTCLNSKAEIIWQLPIGKSHAVPIVDARQRLYLGSWTGEILCFQT
jgi:outer membrane protein assembly factor BamB